VPSAESLTEADRQRVQEMISEVRDALPLEFILASTLTRDGKRVFPDLYFRRDPSVPGRFVAKVDPDFIMGRGRDPKELEELLVKKGEK